MSIPDADAARRRGRLRLVNANTGERLDLRLYDAEGHLTRHARRTLSNFLRCRRTGQKHSIHWRLIRYLEIVAASFGGRALHVYSGYRHRRVSRLRGSYHIKGQAIDFAVEGVGKRTLRDYLRRRFKNVGVGYYPNTPFVHFDVRERRTLWVDLSRPGRPSRYVRDPERYIAREHARLERARRVARAARTSERVVAAGRARPQVKGARERLKVARLGPDISREARRRALREEIRSLLQQQMVEAGMPQASNLP